MENKDWTLLAIAAADGAPLTPVQLQKSLFLLGKKASASVGDRFYRFAPYNYGPFAQQIYSDAEALEAQGFVRVERGAGKQWPEYSVTVAGMRQAQALSSTAGAGGRYLKRAVDWCRSLSFRELVGAIYQEYPDQRVNSVFR